MAKKVAVPVPYKGQPHLARFRQPMSILNRNMEPSFCFTSVFSDHIFVARISSMESSEASILFSVLEEVSPARSSPKGQKWVTGENRNIVL